MHIPTSDRTSVTLVTLLVLLALPAGTAHAQCGTTVQDPGGGSNYGNNANITVTYCPTVPGEVVTLTFTQFGTESCCDFLFLYNGNSTAAPLIGQYSGSNSPGTITSTAPDGCLTLRFTSDGSITGVGWTATVSCGTPPPPPNFCGSTVQDPGGNGNYGNYANYVQTFCPDSPGEVVSLEFTQFGTEACCDFLTVYNGPSTASPVLGTFSGTGLPGTLVSTDPSGCLTIRFTSDLSVTGVGWTAVVNCDPAPDCLLVLNLFDSFGDGWGSSSVGVSVNGGPVQNHTIANGYQRVVPIPVSIGDQVVLSYNNSGTWQNENSYTLLMNGGGLFASGSPPTAGISFVYLVDCIAPLSPPEDCIGAVTICNDLGFNNNTTNTGFVNDLSSTNWDCLAGGEHQGTWYVFSPSASGDLGFTIDPVGNTDYDWALWGPYPQGSSPATLCPPPGAPIRCAASSGPATLANTGDYATGMGHSTFSPPQYASTSASYSIPATTDVCPLPFPQRCGWVPGIQVTEGEVYVLYIDNWDQSGLAFGLNWTLENGASLDCVVLGLDLLGLEARCHDRSVEVLWTLSAEHDVRHYVVERSLDGAHFSPVAQVPSTGHSLVPVRYSVADAGTPPGLLHYRVVQVRADGEARRSQAVSVRTGGRAQPVLAPNPVQDHGTLVVPDGLPTGARLSILDASGRLVQQRPVGEATHLGLSLGHLEAGAYTLALHGPDGAPLGHVRFVRDR